MGDDQLMINFLQKTTKPQLSWGTFLYGAEGGTRQNRCSLVLFGAVMPFVLGFSPVMGVTVSG